MTHRALGAILVLVLVTAGVGPVTATAQPSQTAPAIGPNPGVGPVSPQAASENCSFPVTATDATGTDVTIDEKPQRVVALGASTAQTMWDIGAKKKVVGMPEDSTTAYLDGSRNRTGVFQNDGFTVATEKVVGLDPDLVLAANVIPNETVKTLRGAGLTVYKFDFGGSLSDIYRKTNRTGRLVGACDGATTRVTNTKNRVNAIENAVAGAGRPRVLYAQGGGFVAGNGTFIDDVLEAAGGDNLAVDVGIRGYKQISNETVAARDPQWIIASDASLIPTGEAYAGTTALERNQTIDLNTTLLSQPAPRVVVPMTRIARRLHPEAMRQVNTTNASTQPTGANATNTTSTAATANTTTAATTKMGSTAANGTASGEATTGTTSGEVTSGETTVPSSGSSAARTSGAGNASGGNGSETTSSNGPGFGVMAAAIALLGGVLLARRRP